MNMYSVKNIVNWSDSDLKMKEKVMYDVKSYHNFPTTKTSEVEGRVMQMLTTLEKRVDILLNSKELKTQVKSLTAEKSGKTLAQTSDMDLVIQVLPESFQLICDIVQSLQYLGGFTMKVFGHSSLSADELEMVSQFKTNTGSRGAKVSIIVTKNLPKNMDGSFISKCILFINPTNNQPIVGDINTLRCLCRIFASDLYNENMKPEDLLRTDIELDQISACSNAQQLKVFAPKFVKDRSTLNASDLFLYSKMRSMKVNMEDVKIVNDWTVKCSSSFGST